MKPSERIVTSLPLSELWNDKGRVEAERVRALGGDDIATLLRETDVTFIVAEPGMPLGWIAESNRFSFWKDEVKRHLVAPEATSYGLEDFPGCYCYLASEWRGHSGACVIVLEKQH